MERSEIRLGEQGLKFKRPPCWLHNPLHNLKSPSAEGHVHECVRLSCQTPSGCQPLACETLKMCSKNQTCQNIEIVKPWKQIFRAEWSKQCYFCPLCELGWMKFASHHSLVIFFYSYEDLKLQLVTFSLHIKHNCWFDLLLFFWINIWRSVERKGFNEAAVWLIRGMDE